MTIFRAPSAKTFGRKRKITNELQMKKILRAYFNEMEERNKESDSFKPPTIAGLRHALGVSKSTFNRYLEDEKCQKLYGNTLIDAVNYIEWITEEALFGKETHLGAKYVMGSRFGVNEQKQVETSGEIRLVIDERYK